MAIVHIGIDLAKNVFAVHGVDAAGKPALLRPTLANKNARILCAVMTEGLAFDARHVSVKLA